MSVRAPHVSQWGIPLWTQQDFSCQPPTLSELITANKVIKKKMVSGFLLFTPCCIESTFSVLHSRCISTSKRFRSANFTLCSIFFLITWSTKACDSSLIWPVWIFIFILIVTALDCFASVLVVSVRLGHRQVWTGCGAEHRWQRASPLKLPRWTVPLTFGDRDMLWVELPSLLC